MVGTQSLRGVSSLNILEKITSQNRLPEHWLLTESGLNFTAGLTLEIKLLYLGSLKTQKNLISELKMRFLEWAVQDLNLWPHACRACALAN